MTELFYVPSGSEVAVPEHPTKGQALEAHEDLIEALWDFPFSNAIDRAALLAALLTPIAWSAYHHQSGSPLFMIDGTTPGSGKSLLCDIIALIATGRTMARSPFVEDDDEMRKRILAHCLAGDGMALIDNVENGASIGWPALDGALTSEQVQDRVLGKSETATVPHNVVWFATGNNIAVRGDMARRTIRIRLEVSEERPEERSHFIHQPLLSWVREERPRLLAAALTILRGFFVAGCPQAKVPAFGSFEGWSRIVRQAVMWLGEADPVSACVGRDHDADPDAGAHARALEAWSAVDPIGDGLPVAEVLRDLRDDDRYPELREAIHDLCPTRGGDLPGSRQLGQKLRALKGRRRTVSDGRVLAFVPNGTAHGGKTRWAAKA